ncbi:MAG: transcription termination factor Rho, partial [Streptosporangiaceae bacterium]|nr:transcription termination factor Rho [Streptosporangiaceae bacterium]
RVALQCLPTKGNAFMATTATQETERARTRAQEAREAAEAQAAAQAQGTRSGVSLVSGIIDVTDGHAFVRVSGYRRSPDDVYISAAKIRQYGLRAGDLIEGAARPQDENPDAGHNAKSANGRNGRDGQNGQNGQAKNGRRARGGQHGKYRALDRVDTINGIPPEAARTRPRFDELTPLYPEEWLRLEDGDASATARIIDLVSPIGKGQRGLIVSAPKAGKTMILKAIATAIANSHPEVHLMVVLVGERPEEVTDLRRSVRGEVVYSTFDQSPEDHIRVAELAIERAKRLVELNRDVVVLLDSITRLGRAYNLAAPASSRTLAGGVAASALQPPRQFLGAARNVEDGGSLTILSSALVDTGSRMDDVLFEEFKGTGNMELRLRRELAEKRIFPAIDPMPSGTRRDELLMPPAEHAAVGRLRRALAGLDSQQALQLLIDKTRQTVSNPEFLRQIQQGG